MITYESSSLNANKPYLDEYVDGISIPYDDFLESYILASDIFSILIDGEHVGFFGRQGRLLTIFFVRNANFREANKILADIKGRFDIQEAFVPTTDLGFLSAALEEYKRIEIQALHFTETDAAARPPEFPRQALRLAVEEDLQAIEQMAGDFLEGYAQPMQEQHLYVLEQDGALIGLGVLVDNLIMRNCIGTGMFTREDRRGQGIGRSIILHLREIAHEMGKTPVPGCWYYNTNSRKTLESAGYISKSKLLRFHF